MSLIKSISIQNFKCYRKVTPFDLSQWNFFVGPNNAWKSAILKALHCFFDEKQFIPEYINKTELKSRWTWYNKSVISIEFDLDFVTTEWLKRALKKEFWNPLIISKNFTLREVTGSIAIDYTYNGSTLPPEDANPEILKFLSKIFVSYIHPQEADQLLKTAQQKLTNRLLANWWRSSTLKDGLTELQSGWEKLRKLANWYLSSWLTSNLQRMWSWCEVKVDLPENIEDIIWISEIIFKWPNDLSEISLTCQWTGTQSTILYHTHFLLDSDKTLHRGFYYPIWLIEEPESFLHADIIFKLWHSLCSNDWLDNIQMFVSTHSPLLLATSKQNGNKIRWSLLDQNSVTKSKIVDNWDNNEVKEIGDIMGDPNFDIYFEASENSDSIFIEDSKTIVGEKFKEAWINITNQLNWVAELKRHFESLRSVDINSRKNFYLLIDNDDWFEQFKNILTRETAEKVTSSGFERYKFKNNIFLIVFPKGYAAEEFFTEHDLIVEGCASKIFNHDYTNAVSGVDIPSNLSRTHAHIRNKTLTGGIEEAKCSIRNLQDVKDIFWDEVVTKNLQMNSALIKELWSLLE